MAGKKTSKTARASMPKGRAGAFETSADLPRFVPLNGGSGCYLRDPEDGKTRQFHDLRGEAVKVRLAELRGNPWASKMVAEATVYDTEFPGKGWDGLVAVLQAPAE